MQLPNGLTPMMVRRHVSNGIRAATPPAFMNAEDAARKAEEVVLDGEGESDPQIRFQRCKAKGCEARIRSICDDLGIDHAGWTP